MKTMRLALVLGLLAAGILSAQTATAPASGNGSSGSPYEIASLENLYWIAATDVEVPAPDRATRWAAHYLQTANIDASETSTWDGGGGWTPIGNTTTKFTGNYDGGGHTISGLYIDRSGSSYQGLFGSADSAVFENLGLTGADITGNFYVGILAGRIVNASTVRNVYASGAVEAWNAGGLVGGMFSSIIETSYITGTITGNYSGGLVGEVNSNSTVRNCYSKVIVSGDFAFGNNTIGGLAGLIEGGSLVTNCYSRGSVTRTSGTNTVIGGFAGQNANSTIEHCYSTGLVSCGSETNKGFLGASGGTASYTANFFDTETSGQATSPGATARTTTWMKNHNNFIAAGWDFETETENGTDNHWDMDYTEVINDGYPFLSWENGDDISLPVELTLFAARVEGRSVVLEWVTESEVDNLGFILERSENGGDWISIASYRTHDALKGQGNTSARTEYRFADHTVEPGTTYRYRLSDVSTRGEITRHAPLSITVDAPPDATVMENAYPNPFNPQTYIAYHLAEDSDVTLTVFDLRGRRVRTLHAGNQRAGSYHVYWHGADDAGMRVSSGGYLIRMQAGTVTQIQKVLFMK